MWNDVDTLLPILARQVSGSTQPQKTVQAKGLRTRAHEGPGAPGSIASHVPNAEPRRGQWNVQAERLRHAHTKTPGGELTDTRGSVYRCGGL